MFILFEQKALFDFLIVDIEPSEQGGGTGDNKMC